MLSLKYVMQELSLNDTYVSHWSFGKCKIRIMRPVLKFGTFFFSPKILSPKILKLKKFALVRPGPKNDISRHELGSAHVKFDRLNQQSNLIVWVDLNRY